MIQVVQSVTWFLLHKRDNGECKEHSFCYEKGGTGLKNRTPHCISKSNYHKSELVGQTSPVAKKIVCY